MIVITVMFLNFRTLENVAIIRVGKILTAQDFLCGKSRDFPGWEIPSKFGKLGNTGKYLIKILNFVVFL